MHDQQQYQYSTWLIYLCLSLVYLCSYSLTDCAWHMYGVSHTQGLKADGLDKVEASEPLTQKVCVPADKHSDSVPEACNGKPAVKKTPLRVLHKLGRFLWGGVSK